MSGVRDLDGGERVELERAGVRHRAGRQAGDALDGEEVYVHLDLDVLDPSVLPVAVPRARRAVDARACATLLGEVAESARIVGVEITAFEAPDDDRGRAASRLATMIESVVEPLPVSRCCARSSRTCTSAARRRGSAAAQEKIAKQHAADKLTARERIALLIDEGTFTELGLHAQPALLASARWRGARRPPTASSPATARSTGGSSRSCAYDFTVMAGSMGMTGEMKVARLRELALTKRMPFVWLLDSAGRAHPGGGRLAVRRLRPPVPRGGHRERRDPAGRGADGAVRGGHRLHPRARRLRADGQGPRLDGARRPAPRARGDRRGRHAGGARRLARALPQVGRRRPRGRRPTRSASQAIKDYLSFFPSHCEEAPPRRRRVRPGRPRRRGAARRAPRVQPQALRHVRGHPPHRRRRRVVRPQAEWAKTIITCLARIGGRPVGHRRVAAAGSSAASSTTTRPTRPRASSTSATRSGSRSSSSWTCRASWSARRSRRRASSATARRCSTRSPTRRSRRSRS